MTLSSLLSLLEDTLKPSLFEDYCPNGLQIQGQENITKIAFAVSATKESINKSLEWGAQALIVHHGLFWKHQGTKTITGPWGERIKTCIQHNLNLIAYHLPLDAHLELGNAASLAKQIELKEISSFAPHKGQFLGVKGKFHEPISAKNLKLKLQKILQHSIILASHDEDELISSLGIVTGGANNEWTCALKDKLDAYVTGEISEYNWHDAIEAEIHFFAGGHHATEKFGILSLMEKIKENSFEVQFFDSDNLA